MINEAGELRKILPPAAFTLTEPVVVKFPRLILPIAPAVSKLIKIFPLPAFRVVSGAIVTAAAPGSRLGSCASLLLAVRVILPLPPDVSISALILMLRPAFSCKFAIALACMGSLTVMSLLACRLTSPLKLLILLASKVASPLGLAPKALFPKTLSAPPLPMIIFLGSKSTVPALPFAAETSTVPRKIRFSFPDISTNPPLPEFSPPLALTLP